MYVYLLKVWTILKYCLFTDTGIGYSHQAHIVRNLWYLGRTVRRILYPLGLSLRLDSMGYFPTRLDVSANTKISGQYRPDGEYSCIAKPELRAGLIVGGLRWTWERP